MLGIILWAAAVAAPRTDFCILSAEEQGSALAILAPDGKLRARVEVGAWPHEVEVSLDGRTAYVTQFGLTDYDSRVGAPGDHVARIDLATATVTGRYQLPENLRAPHGVKLRPGTDELFVNAESGGDTMLVYDAAAGRLVRTFPLGKGSHNFVFSRDGRFVFVFAGAEGVAKYDASNGNLLVSQVLDTPVRGLRLAADGTVVAAAKGKVAVLDPRNLRVRRWLAAPVAGQLVYLETLTDGTIVAPSMDDNGVAWFAKDGRARFIPAGKGALNVRFAPDGKLYVADVDDDHLTVLSASGKVVAHVGHGIKGPNGLAFGVCPQAARRR